MNSDQSLPLKRLSFYSTLAGASSLIPVPVLDDWVYRLVYRRMLRDTLRIGSELSKKQLKVLSGHSSGFWGQNCLFGILLVPIRAVVYLLKRVFRKIFFLLALKEATDRASATFHEGYLFGYAFASRSDLGGQEKQRMEQLRHAVTETLQEVDTSPVRAAIRGTFKGGKSVLYDASEKLTRLARQKRRQDPSGEELDPETLQEEEQILGGLSDRLASDMQAREDYLSKLRKRFDEVAQRRGIAEPSRE